MSRFVFVSVLALAGFGAGTVLSAQSAPVSSPSAGVAVQAAPQPAKAPADRNCIRHTGSLVPAKKGGCLPVSGRSYSQQDIQRTGRIGLGAALQTLDPSVSVRGH